MIKVGQIYKRNSCIYAVCFVGLGYKNSEQVQLINPNGFTYGYSLTKFERYGGDLIAEYPTWQEAVNSKEFNNGR